MSSTQAFPTAPELFDLSGKVALVTGSGRGLGKVIAEGLAEAGAAVVVSARTTAEAEATAAGIVERGGTAEVVTADVSEYGDCERLVAEAVQRLGSLDVLVNNAGIDIIAPAEEATPADYQQIIDINMTGVFNCAQVAGRVMLEQEQGGSIVNISSIAGLIGIHGLVAYSAAKGGVNQITRVMAAEWASRGVRVNAICPAYFENVMRNASDEHSREEKQEQIRTFTPMGRRGHPRELIGPVTFLASAASSYVTGALLCVDGGYTAT